MSGKLLMLLCILGVSNSDWVSEWMVPVKNVLKDKPNPLLKGSKKSIFKDVEKPDSETTSNPFYRGVLGKTNGDLSTSRLKAKLQSTLDNANMLTQTLQSQILELTSQEHTLKEAIANGRSGVTTVVVSTIGQLPRSYMVREGVWTLCTGTIQPPLAEARVLKGPFSKPRCFGQELPTTPDACVFNSVIKYETIPTRRRLQYVEDDYLCLRLNFNETLGQYLTVPKRIINETCADGTIRSLNENLEECGMRVLSEYTYYPDTGFNSPRLPLEYCSDDTGACKLMVAWHVSNASIENFEFFKNEPKFKSFFINSESFVHRII